MNYEKIDVLAAILDVILDFRVKNPQTELAHRPKGLPIIWATTWNHQTSRVVVETKFVKLNLALPLDLRKSYRVPLRYKDENISN